MTNISSFRVMSWNIENIGKSKLNDVVVKKRKAPPFLNQEPGEIYIVDFIDAVVQLFNVDVLGIMEVRGGEADTILELLIKALPGQWESVAATQQIDARAEQSVYLWRKAQQPTEDEDDDEPCQIFIDDSSYLDAYLPAPASLVGIIDDNSLSEFFDYCSIKTDDDKQWIYDALVEKGYIYKPNYVCRKKRVKPEDNRYRVNQDKWSKLQSGDETVNFDGIDLPFTVSQRALVGLTNVLISSDIIMFPTSSDRSPFVLSLTLQNSFQALPIVISMLHAPGSSDPQRFPAIYNHRLYKPFIFAENLLVMGDFNITGPVRDKASFLVYDRILDPQTGLYSFGPLPGGAQKIDPFDGLIEDPIKARDLLGDMVKTSVKNPSTELDFDNSKSEAYDKFFFRSKHNTMLDFGTADVVDLTKMIYAEIDGNEDYIEELAKLCIKYFKTRNSLADLQRIFNNIEKKRRKRGASQSSKKNKANQRKSTRAPVSKAPGSTYSRRTRADQMEIEDGDTEMQELDTQSAGISQAITSLEPATVLVPPNINSVLAAYGAISDHLPICVELSFQGNDQE